MKARLLVFALCAAGVAARTTQALMWHPLDHPGDRMALAWQCLPFVVIAVLATIPWRVTPWLGAAVAVLASDLFVLLMMALKAGTRGGEGWGYIGLMYMPLFHLLFIAPGAALLTGLVDWWRRRSRAAQAPPAGDGGRGA